MDLLLFSSLLVTGFVGCAEFGSMALVHPVIRRLPPEGQLVMEKGLLCTFGRIMPVGMTIAPILTGILAARDGGALVIAASPVLALALVITIIGNVPINARTGRISSRAVPGGFAAMRRRWDVLQTARASLQLVGFALALAAASMS